MRLSLWAGSLWPCFTSHLLQSLESSSVPLTIMKLVCLHYTFRNYVTKMFVWNFHIWKRHAVKSFWVVHVLMLEGTIHLKIDIFSHISCLTVEIIRFMFWDGIYLNCCGRCVIKDSFTLAQVISTSQNLAQVMCISLLPGVQFNHSRSAHDIAQPDAWRRLFCRMSKRERTTLSP